MGKMESGQQPLGGAPVADQAAEPSQLDALALARGEPLALEAFCRELLDPVYAFVFWRVGGDRQDAEDVTQETFLAALATIDRFEGRSSLHTWVCGIAKNLARERVRARNRAPRLPDQGGEAAAADVLLEEAQTERLVGLALTELAPHYQRALLDKYVHQQSFREMATATRSTAKAVESLVQRAKRALAEAVRRLGLVARDGDSHE
jgi:RNA polymerase sigma-70 factor, ECF subfamily